MTTVAQLFARTARRFHRFVGADAWTRWGMTFAEALIMIVVAGSLMIPVVGTLQTGVDRTNAYVHQDRMRTIAQASMTEILAGSAYARTPVVDFTATVTWPINDPEVVATYVMEVEALEGITLATLTSDVKGDFAGNEAMIGSQPANLKTVVVTVTHVPDPGDVGVEPAQVRLFSMVATPRSFNPNRIYIADKDSICIYAIDPLTKNVVETFDLPFSKTPKTKTENDPDRPGNIAVHPNGDWVLTQRDKSLLLTDVGLFSSTRRTSTVVYATSATHLEKPNDNEAIRKDRGVAFRPDGRYCYVTSHAPAGLSILSIPDGIVASFSLVKFLPMATAKFVDLQVGEDGYLYIGDYDNTAKCFRRLNMFAPQNLIALEDYSLPGWLTSTNKKAMAACTSRDGRRVFSVWEGAFIASSSSDNPADWGVAEINHAVNPGGEDIQDVQVSGDNRVVIATSKQGGGKTRIFAMPTELRASTITAWSEPPNRVAYPGSGDITNQAVLSPAMNEVWVDRKGAGEIYALDTPSLLAGSYTTAIPTDRTVLFLPSGDAGCVAARMSEMVAVACDGTTKTIEFIDPWSKHHYENLTRKLPYANTPTHLAFNGAGSLLSVCYNASSTLPTAIDAFNGNIQPTAIDPENWGVTVDRKPTHHVFYQNGGFLIQKYGSTVSANGYVSFDASGMKQADVDFPLTTSMSDVIPLNDGGALVLVNDVDRKQTRLDRLGPDASLKASYCSWLDGFPQFPTTKMAVSADDGLLALYRPSLGGKRMNTIMTGNTAPAPCRTFIPQGAGGYQGFDGSTAAGWAATTNNAGTYYPMWVTYDFGMPVRVTGVRFIAGNWGPSFAGPNTFTVFGSTDNFGSSNVTLFNGTGAGTTAWQEFGFTNTNSYRYYRFQANTSFNAATDPSFGLYYCTNVLEMEFTGSTPEVVQIYDLRNNYFGEMTTRNGLISEVRNSTTGNFAVSPYITHKFSSFSTANRPLYEAFTASDTLTSQRAWPGNFWDTSGYRYRGHAQRFFGYFSPAEYDIQRIGGQYCNYFRLFFEGADAFSAWNVNAGYPFFNVAKTFLKERPASIQIDSSDQANDDILGGVFWSANAAESTPTSSTQDGYAITGMTPGDWKRIPASMTRPLLFAPTCLREWSEASANASPDRYFMCFSRDVASPTLYVFNAETSNLAAIPFGGNIVQQSLAASITANAGQGMAITPDGQMLLIPTKGANCVNLVDISIPARSTYLNVRDSINLPYPPIGIAARPFNRINTKRNTYEAVTTLAQGIAGCNMAAVASGGIYVLAPNAACYDFVSKKALQFDPMKNSATDKGDKLARAIAAHSVFAYDGDLYAYNGAYNTSHSDVHAWVQRWNPTTNATCTSTDPVSNLPSGLVSHWKFDEGSGATAGDSAGTNHGTTSGSPTWVAGKYGTCLNFDGTNDFVNCGSDASLKFGTANFTLAFWFKTGVAEHDSSGWAWRSMISWGNCYQTGYGRVGLHVPGGFSTGEFLSGYWSNAERVTGTSNLADNTWHHAALVRNGNSFQFYLDGAANGAAVTDSVNFNLSLFAIGKGPWNDGSNGGEGWFKGQLDDVQVYNRALSVAEISIAKNGGTTPAIPAGIYLSKTVADDAATEIKRRYSGGAMTPFGYVVGGGFDGTSACYTNFQVYWPHAIASYTASNNHLYGITRDLPPMPTAVGCHALVYHKGYIYRIGGRNAGGSLVSGINRFNLSDNSWSNLSSPAGVDRILPAVCSFGDEIFIFGGMTAAGGVVNNNLAWNPETNAVRSLENIPKTGQGISQAESAPAVRTIGMTAVPCGPAIYLFGGGTAANSGGSGQVLKYTP